MTLKNRKKESWKEYLAKVDTPKLKKLRKLSFWGFAVFYAALIVALVIFGKWFLGYCSESFVLYENSQLSLAEEQIMAQLNGADGAALKTMLSSPAPVVSPFDDAAAVHGAAYDRLAQKQLSCRRIEGYDPARHDYQLYADGVLVGSFAITSAGEETRLGLLTISTWQYGGGEVGFEYESYSRSCTVPEGFTVMINGKTLGDEYIVGEVKPISAFKYVSEYVDMPGMVTYEVTGLFSQPQLSILDNNGNAVPLDPAQEKVELEKTYMPTQIPEELETMAIEYATVWANYSLKDADLKDVEALLIKGSFLHEQIREFNYERRWIDKHILIGFENQQVLEYISYGENCFACRVYMERTVRVELTWELDTDTLDDVFYFVRLDLTDDGVDNPQWYIADMLAA